MSVNRIIERVAQNQGISQAPKPQKTEFRPEWAVAVVFTWGSDGPEEFPKEVFEARDQQALEGRVLCVVKQSNHFPPRFETNVGAFHQGRVSTLTGFRIDDSGLVVGFGEYTPEKGAALLLAAQTFIGLTMVQFVGENNARIHRAAQRRRDQENGPGGANLGVTPHRTGKTERNRAKKTQRPS